MLIGQAAFKDMRARPTRFVVGFVLQSAGFVIHPRRQLLQKQ
jgi:hypothetical protein